MELLLPVARRLEDVVVGQPLGHRVQDRLGRRRGRPTRPSRSAARASRAGAAARAVEHVRARPLGHPDVGEHDRHVRALVPEALELALGGPGVALTERPGSPRRSGGAARPRCAPAPRGRRRRRGSPAAASSSRPPVWTIGPAACRALEISNGVRRRRRQGGSRPGGREPEAQARLQDPDPHLAGRQRRADRDLGRHRDRHFFWPVFPIGGWAIGLVFQGWYVYGPGARPISEDEIQRESDRLRSLRDCDEQHQRDRAGEHADGERDQVGGPPQLRGH